MDMDIHDIRRENLVLLIVEAGSVKRLAEICDTNHDWLSYVSGLPTPEDVRTGKRPRNIGSRLARQLERGMGLDRGWMDVRHDLTDQQKMLIKIYAELSDKSRDKLVEYAKMLRDLDQVSANTPATDVGPDTPDTQKPSSAKPTQNP